MDFDEFRRKKKAEQERLRKAAEEQARGTASGKEADWIDGLGPAGQGNPAVRGFVQGRYKRERVDPRALRKPSGYETYSKRTAAAIVRRVECCNEAVPPEMAIVICHGCKKLYHPQCIYEESDGVCCEGRAMLLAPPPRPRNPKSIAQDVAAAQRPRGMTKF
ncbi:MAG: hypothetical protein D6731_20705 [Planctomycetota bacterium]|nr:MAG: hypothetical protein D6731_20705 [Planctomycetota bacterium]